MYRFLWIGGMATEMTIKPDEAADAARKVTQVDKDTLRPPQACRGPETLAGLLRQICFVSRGHLRRARSRYRCMEVQ